MNRKNIKGESLIGIIIAISLLWFVILWIANIISYSNNITSNYEISSTIDLIKDNTLTIVKKLDMTNINDWEEFYLNKNYITKEISIFTWTINENYKYIDSLWNNIDIWVYIWDIYERVITLEKKDLITSNNIFRVDIIKKNN